MITIKEEVKQLQGRKTKVTTIKEQFQKDNNDLQRKPRGRGRPRKGNEAPTVMEDDYPNKECKTKTCPVRPIPELEIITKPRSRGRPRKGNEAHLPNDKTKKDYPNKKYKTKTFRPRKGKDTERETMTIAQELQQSQSLSSSHTMTKENWLTAELEDTN